MAKKLVLAGGGHAHMTILANLNRFVEKGYEVIVIQPSPYHYYSGMGPGMLGRNYTPDEIRFATKHVVEKQGCRFILDKVMHVDPKEFIVHLEKSEPISYDVISFNIGSYVPQTVVTKLSDNIFTVKPIERLFTARKRILEAAANKKVKIAIVGGGASGVEIAGNVWALTNAPGLYPAEIKIFARSVLMAHSPQKVRQLAFQSLSKRNIQIAEQSEITAIDNGFVELAQKDHFNADFIFVAVGVHPSPVFGRSGLTIGPDGGLMVNKFLQSVDYPNMFGGGDCIYFKDNPLDKVGVYAVRENPVLLHNLMAALENSPLQEFHPGGDYLLIYNLGDETGIFRKKFVTFNGRMAFLIKDYIDRKFMKKFQAIE